MPASLISVPTSPISAAAGIERRHAIGDGTGKIAVQYVGHHGTVSPNSTAASFAVPITAFASARVSARLPPPLVEVLRPSRVRVCDSPTPTDPKNSGVAVVEHR
ncbi:MAG: hypothetical protein WDN04_27095 [Rhodospirillales bacterium]